MRITTPKKSKKKIILATTLLVVVVAGAFVFAYAFRPLTGTPAEDTKDLKNTSSTKGSSTKKDNSKDDDTISNKSEPTVEKEKDNPTQYEGSNPNTSESLTGSINYLSVIDGNLTVRITINQVLSTGSCTLTLTNGNKTVSRSSSIVQNPSSSTCDGFNVPVSELSSGKWKASVSVESDNRKGTFTSEVNV